MDRPVSEVIDELVNVIRGWDGHSARLLACRLLREKLEHSSIEIIKAEYDYNIGTVEDSKAAAVLLNISSET